MSVKVFKVSEGEKLTPAPVPTMYFIGVTTGSSSIMKVFPEWAKALGIDAVMTGIDIAIHEKPEIYREVVRFIKEDPLSLGALVTTHKLDIFNAASDMFDEIGTYAKQFGEMSSIYKRDGKYCCEAKDPITCGMAMEQFVQPDYWKKNPEAGVMIMGAGGSCISMCSYYMRNFGKHTGSPKEIVVANRSTPRLEECRKINEKFYPNTIPAKYFLTPEPGQNDKVMEENMGKGSLIINATGLGKDRPGSPLTDAAQFPENAIVWEINYRGELTFEHQAEAQQAAKNLNIQDGWMYFIFGWTQVIADVFNQEILGEKLEMCSEIAKKATGRA